MPKSWLCILIVVLNVFQFSFSDPSNPFDLCSLAPLDPKVGFFDDKSGLRLFWNLCHGRNNTTSALKPCGNDSTAAAVCVFKKDSKTGNFSVRAANAGKIGDHQLKYEAIGHYSLTLSGSSECVKNSSQVFSTRFDFFCNDNEEEQSPAKSVMLMNHSDHCNFNLFWHTSLACTSEKDDDDDDKSLKSNSVKDSCVVRVPGFDQKLDLKAIRDAKFYIVHSDDQKRHFQLNICDAVKSGACLDGSPLCEVSDKATLVESIVPGSTLKMSTSFDKSTQNVILKYGSTASNRTAIIDLVCDQSAVTPSLQFVGAKLNVLKFRIKTSRVCLFTPKSCVVKDGDKVYDLASLTTSSRDWVAYDQRPGFESQRYFISVCKPLPPASLNHSCPNVQASVCQSTVNSQASNTLASAEESDLSLNIQDGSLILNYGDGTACNAKYNYSSQIIFRCSSIEKGPILSDVTDDCTYIFEWLTPEACVKSGNVETNKKCQVKDSIFGNTFDLSELHNTDKDYNVNLGSGVNYGINVCGSTTSPCGKEKGASVCKVDKDGKTFVAAHANTETLTNMDGQIALDFSGDTCGGENQTYHTKILFKCDHKVQKGQPEFVSEGPCQTYFIWKTTYACPPFEEVECKVEDKNGLLYDLSGLSLPNDNYELHTGGTSKFLLNVCRSIVRQIDYNCPYHSAACAANIDVAKSQNWTFSNIGQVAQGPSFDQNGRLVLEYGMGAMCKDIKSEDTHLSTKIIFKCRHGLLDSEPEFVEQIGCTYVFFWETDSACPTSERNFGEFGSDGKNCKIRHPKNGHVFDLSQIKLDKNLETKDGSGNVIQINICAPIIRNGSAGYLSGCGSESGSCMTDGAGRSFNLGDFNSTLTWSSNQELTLKYSTRNSTSESTRNETIIRFRCGPMRNETHAVYIEHRSGTTFLDVFTSLACEHTVFCQAKTPGKSLSLFSLMDYRQNVESKIGEETIFFSVCKPLADKKGLNCPNDAAVCSAIADQNDAWKNEKSYGMAMTSPTFNAKGDIEIRYVNGSVCDEDASLNYQTKITFKCKPGAFPGKPILDAKNVKKCQKDFVWQTMVACSKKSGSQSDTDCKMFHPILDQVIDLSNIQTNPKKDDFEIETSDHIYFLQPCKSLSTKCKSPICMANKSSNVTAVYTPMGTINSVIYGFDRNELILRYKSNVTCQDETFFSAEIHFRCDDSTPKNDSSYNKPTLLEELPCHPIFQWDTPVVCGVQSGDLGLTAVNPEKRASSITGGVIFFLAIVIVTASILLLRKPENRERCRQSVTRFGEQTVTLCRSFGRRRRSDDQRNLLGNRVNVPAFGSINDEDDVDLILA